MKLATLSNKTLPRFATSTGRDKCLNLFQVPLPNAERLNLKCVVKVRKGEKKNGAKRFVGTKVFKTWSTIRCFSGTTMASSEPSKRAINDLGNQIRWSQTYKDETAKHSQPAGTYLTPETAEWFSGLPKHWTKPVANCMHVFRSMFPYAESEAPKCPIVSLFTGRSEVYAILAAVAAYKRLTIYTDCEAAMHGLVYILDCLDRDITPFFQDHADLWDLMYSTLKQNQTLVRVVKVKAHSEHLFHTTPFEQWCSQSNAFVDKEAKQSILVGNADIFQAFHHQYECLAGNRSALKEILQFQADIATKSFHTRVQTQIQNEQQLATGFVPRGHFNTMDCNLTLDECAECKFNQVFLHHLATWAVSLQWDLNTNKRF